MPTARYWRFNITAVDGGTFASASEFQLYASADGTGTNLSLAGTASQTGDGAVGPASSAKDGSTATEAGSSFTAPGPYIWTIDLGSAQDVNSAGIITQRIVPNRTAKDFTVQYSSDNTNWTTARAITGQTGWTEFERRVFAFQVYAASGTVRDSAGNFAARAVRLYRRDTGALLGATTSNATTGAFSVQTEYSGACTVVVLDADGGAANALIFDRITPVAV